MSVVLHQGATTDGNVSSDDSEAASSESGDDVLGDDEISEDFGASDDSADEDYIDGVHGDEGKLPVRSLSTSTARRRRLWRDLPGSYKASEARQAFSEYGQGVHPAVGNQQGLPTDSYTTELDVDTIQGWLADLGCVFVLAKAFGDTAIFVYVASSVHKQPWHPQRLCCIGPPLPLKRT